MPRSIWFPDLLTNDTMAPPFSLAPYNLLSNIPTPGPQPLDDLGRYGDGERDPDEDERFVNGVS